MASEWVELEKQVTNVIARIDELDEEDLRVILLGLLTQLRAIAKKRREDE